MTSNEGILRVLHILSSEITAPEEGAALEEANGAFRCRFEAILNVGRVTLVKFQKL